jgi:C-terminal processing protease CtpA/Prc
VFAVNRGSLLPSILAAALAAGCGGSGGGSVGAVLGRSTATGALHVREVPKGLGADRAGLAPGDEIVMIDGVYVRDLGAKELQAKLRGDVGSTVSITVVRGGTVRHVVLTRTELRARAAPRPKEERLDE